MADAPLDDALEGYEAPAIVPLGAVGKLTTQDETSLDDPS